jgi:hypothetical protein
MRLTLYVPIVSTESDAGNMIWELGFGYLDAPDILRMRQLGPGDWGRRKTTTWGVW